ncbi:MAG TPA: hypothetical protein VM223_11845 [Planctomycetota bacterium]|nr:hypothetical protein [Planctomycetota bacterium]
MKRPASTMLMGVLGMLVGGGVAVGVPYVVLAFGRVSGVAAFALSALGIIGGVLLAGLAALLSMFVPPGIGMNETISRNDTISASTPESEYDDYGQSD